MFAKNLRFNIECINSPPKEESTAKLILSTFFLTKERLICFLFKYSLLGKQVWNLFFTFPKYCVRGAMGNATFYWVDSGMSQALYVAYD